MLPQQKHRHVKFGYTLPILANLCLPESTEAKLYPITRGDKDILQKVREDMVGGPSFVVTRKAVIVKTFIRKSHSLCKSIVGIDASHLYYFSMCQPMPTGLYTHWDPNAETGKCITRQNKTCSFENKVMFYIQCMRHGCKIENF